MEGCPGGAACYLGLSVGGFCPDVPRSNLGRYVEGGVGSGSFLVVLSRVVSSASDIHGASSGLAKGGNVKIPVNGCLSRCFTGLCLDRLSRLYGRRLGYGFCCHCTSSVIVLDGSGSFLRGILVCVGLCIGAVKLGIGSGCRVCPISDEKVGFINCMFCRARALVEGSVGCGVVELMGDCLGERVSGGRFGIEVYTCCK